jgi:hypothetical protein
MASYEITIREKDGARTTTVVSGASKPIAAMVVAGTALRAESRGATVIAVREKST